jgi:hypothetical protein
MCSFFDDNQTIDKDGTVVIHELDGMEKGGLHLGAKISQPKTLTASVLLLI